MAFREAESRVCKDRAGQTLATMRHIVLNLPKPETTRKIGIQHKHLKAGWHEAYLPCVLGGLFK